MYPLYFYRDRHGTCPVEEYLNALFARNDKDSRIKLKKIQDYMNILQQYGMSLSFRAKSAFRYSSTGQVPCLSR